jgi:hypothetical protein
VPTSRLLAALSVVSGVSLLADALAPLLLPHAPLLLAVASPRSIYVIAVARRVPLVVLVPLVTIRLCVTDPIHFELGRRVPIGPTGHGVVGRAGRRLRRFVDTVPGFGFVLAVAAWPVSHTLLAAGAGGTSRRRVAVADVVGTAARVVVISAALGRIDSMVSAASVASHIGPVACLSFASYTAIAVVARRRRNAAAASWESIANQVESLRLEERVLATYGLAWDDGVVVSRGAGA